MLLRCTFGGGWIRPSPSPNIQDFNATVIALHAQGTLISTTRRDFFILIDAISYR